MTAEIAIVNRSAITIAADSAMTLTNGVGQKAYVPTEKIFDLSNNNAIAIMIYNCLEFGGAPADIVINAFVASLNCHQFEYLANAPTAFFDYFTTQWSPSYEAERRHVRGILTRFFLSIWVTFERIYRLSDSTQEAQSSLDLLVECIAKKVAELEELPVAKCFVDVSENDISELYLDLIDSVINQIFSFPPLLEHSLNTCRRLGILSLHRDTFSDMLSGLVFAGYGSSEFYPTLISYHMDGIIAGRLKIQEIEYVSMAGDHAVAKVIPFAQREVTDRFFSGSSPEFQTGVVAYVSGALKLVKSAIFKDVKRLGLVARESINQNFDRSVENLVADLRDAWREEAEKSMAKQTQDMLKFMCKQDCVSLASSLISITSIKKRYSGDGESVAEPIDVVIISKSDGVVWVRRRRQWSS